VRTDYSAIADEWVSVKPETDGAFRLVMIHEVIDLGLYDRGFLIRYTNAKQLVNIVETDDAFGLLLRTGTQSKKLLRPKKCALVGWMYGLVHYLELDLSIIGIESGNSDVLSLLICAGGVLSVLHFSLYRHDLRCYKISAGVGQSPYRR